MASTKPVGAAPKASSRPRGVRRIITVLVVAVLLLASAFGIIYYVQDVTVRNQAWLDQRLELKANIDLLTKISREASQGLEPDFRALTDLTVEQEGSRGFGSLIDTFATGDPENNMDPLPGDFLEDVSELKTTWNDNQSSIQGILANAEAYQRTSSNVAQVLDALNAVRQTYEQLPPDRVVSNQLLRLERIGATARTLTGLGPDVATAAATLERLSADFQSGQTVLATGATAATVKQAAEAFAPIVTAIATIKEDAPKLAQYQEAAGGFLAAATNIITAGNAVDQDVLDAVAGRQIDPRIAYLLGIIGLGLLGVAVVLFILDARRRVTEAVDRDTRQQKAILELLDEITNLADGDLTVDVTVTEDFTGAIADSINYTVGSMRSLVGTINTTSVELSAAASTTADTARKMNQASERQAKEVANVTTAIVASSQQLEKVAGRAESLAQDAQRSVQVARNGAETVNRTIQNMASLREQIQDTAKRIKRLGESSQEIGNIIEFINDISEQTNTLALNASIQAAMAGEQGRGFAVVADEVQRLAERAANATRQIENLVKTIQADTTEAIVSMERSTANVVAGAKSAEEAGQALTQVEGASNDLARLIQEISAQARGQSAAATKIAGTMQVIRDIAVQTAGSAAQTANAVGSLNALSDKMRQAVAGFKLPENLQARAAA
ncbi:MAG: methyl-accepting chemotaxis protein [Gammaproteobacteria bacterium]